MVRWPTRRVQGFIALVYFATQAVATATGSRPFIIRFKPYDTNRYLPLMPPSAPSSSTAKHCVWRVTNVPAPFYLVGTIHSLRAGDYPLAEIYRKALNDSQRLLFEYNPKERAAYEKKFRAAGQYADGKDIRSGLRPETQALLMRNLSVFHLRFDEIKKYKPWALAFRLWSIKGYAAAAQTLSVDGYLSYQAQRLGKEVGGLETVDEHVAFWGNMLELDGENMLLASMNGRNKLNERFEQTRDAWKRGDVAALSATNENLRNADSRAAQRLLDRRNVKWLSRIEAEMKTGKATSIVAGAGHFSGPNSVVDLLQKRGYKIEQL
jgi:uncharacterized protein